MAFRHHPILTTITLSILVLFSSKTFAEEARPHSVEEQMHHLMRAAENLDAAGMEREADELRERAKRMELELREHRGQHPENIHHEVIEHLREIHHAVSELRHEVKELRRDLEQMRNRTPPVTWGQPNFDPYIPGPDGYHKSIPNPHRSYLQPLPENKSFRNPNDRQPGFRPRFEESATPIDQPRIPETQEKRRDEEESSKKKEKPSRNSGTNEGSPFPDAFFPNKDEPSLGLDEKENESDPVIQRIPTSKPLKESDDFDNL